MCEPKHCYNCLHSHFSAIAFVPGGPQPSAPEPAYVDCKPLNTRFQVEILDKLLPRQFSCNYWEAAPLEDFDDIYRGPAA